MTTCRRLIAGGDAVGNPGQQGCHGVLVQRRYQMPRAARAQQRVHNVQTDVGQDLFVDLPKSESVPAVPLQQYGNVAGDRIALRLRVGPPAEFLQQWAQRRRGQQSRRYLLAAGVGIVLQIQIGILQ